MTPILNAVASAALFGVVCFYLMLMRRWRHPLLFVLVALWTMAAGYRFIVITMDLALRDFDLPRLLFQTAWIRDSTAAAALIVGAVTMLQSRERIRQATDELLRLNGDDS